MNQIKRLAFLAMIALAATAIVGTTAASASKFTAGKVGVKLNETTVFNHTLSITGSSVTCSEINFAGSTEALEKETQTLKPTYSGCTAFGFAGATVNTSGCSYTFSANGFVTLSGCTAGGITVTVNVPFIAKCVVEIPNQTFIGIFYTNGVGLSLTFNSFLNDEVKESTGACPLTVGKHSNASYTGESKMLAEGTYFSWDA